MDNTKFIFDGRPFEIRGSEVYRLHYEKDGRVYSEIRLAHRNHGNKQGYTLSGAFFSLEEIINLAKKPQHEYKESILINQD